MSRGARKDAPPCPARSLRRPAPPRGAERGGDFARDPGKFGAPRAPVRTLVILGLIFLVFFENAYKKFNFYTVH